MATYSLLSYNGMDYVKAVGTGVTAQALHTFIQANPTVGESYGYSDASGTMFRFDADILLGDSSNSGSATTWDISNQQIFIDVRTTFEIHGILSGGNLDADGFSQNGCSLRLISPSIDKVLFKDNGELNLYGSHIYANARLRIDGNDCAFRVIDSDRELEDDIEPSTSQNLIYDVSRSRVHHTGGVGLKTFSFAPSGSRTQFTLTDVKIQKCAYAFQAGLGTILTARGVEIDSCTNHLVGFVGNGSVIRFIDSDVPTSLRMLAPPSNGIFSLENSYTFSAKDLQQNPLEGVSTWIVDQQGDIRVEATTDASGNLITAIDTLNRKTYIGATETTREAHTVFYRSPSTIWGETPINVSGISPVSINLFLIIDSYYTQTDLVAQAHTGITIIDHGNTPVTWNSLEYRFTVSCDTTVNPSLDIEDVYNYLKYRQSQVGTFAGLDTREVHQFITVVGGDYYTNTSDISYYSGIQGGVRVVDQNDDGLLGVDRHYSNSGAYFQGAEESSISIPNVIDNSRVVAINYTKSTKIIDQYGQEIITVPSLIDNTIVSGGNGYSHTFTVGGNSTHQLGDIVLLKVNWQSGTQAKIPLRLFQVITESGITAIDVQEDDLIHNNMIINGIAGYDGSLADSSNGGELTANFTDVEINVNDADDSFDCQKGIAWWRWINTTELGALYYDALGLAYVPDERNIEIRGRLKLKNSKPNSELVIFGGVWKHYQGESIITTGATNASIQWVPNDRLYNSNSTQITDIKVVVDQYLDATISSRSTQTSVDAIDTSNLATTADITALNDFNPSTDIVANVALVDTVTTNTDMRGTDNALLGSAYVEPDNTSVSPVSYTHLTLPTILRV